MDIFKDINVDDIRKDYVDVVRYCQRYLNFEKTNPTELWHKVHLLCKDKTEGCGIALAFLKCYAGEIYNHLKVVKID